MRHIIALAIKTLMVAAVHFVIMNVVYDYPIGPTFALALLVTALAYLTGDLGILPMTNNTVATLSDVGLVTFTIWLLGPFLVNAPISFFVALIIGLIIGAGEWFFHKYVQQSVIPRKGAL